MKNLDLSQNQLEQKNAKIVADNLTQYFKNKYEEKYNSYITKKFDRRYAKQDTSKAEYIKNNTKIKIENNSLIICYDNKEVNLNDLPSIESITNKILTAHANFDPNIGFMKPQSEEAFIMCDLLTHLFFSFQNMNLNSVSKQNCYHLIRLASNYIDDINKKKSLDYLNKADLLKNVEKIEEHIKQEEIKKTEMLDIMKIFVIQEFKKIQGDKSFKNLKLQTHIESKKPNLAIYDDVEKNVDYFINTDDLVGYISACTNKIYEKYETKNPKDENIAIEAYVGYTLLKALNDKYPNLVTKDNAKEYENAQSNFQKILNLATVKEFISNNRYNSQPEANNAATDQEPQQNPNNTSFSKINHMLKLVKDWFLKLISKIKSFFGYTDFDKQNTTQSNASDYKQPLSATLKKPTSENEVKVLGYKHDNCYNPVNSNKLANGSALLLEIPKNGKLKYILHAAPASKSEDNNKTLDNIAKSIDNGFKLIEENYSQLNADFISIPLIGGAIFSDSILENLTAAEEDIIEVFISDLKKNNINGAKEMGMGTEKFELLRYLAFLVLETAILGNQGILDSDSKRKAPTLVFYDYGNNFFQDAYNFYIKNNKSNFPILIKQGDIIDDSASVTGNIGIIINPGNTDIDTGIFNNAGGASKTIATKLLGCTDGRMYGAIAGDLVKKMNDDIIKHVRSCNTNNYQTKSTDQVLNNDTKSKPKQL